MDWDAEGLLDGLEDDAARGAPPPPGRAARPGLPVPAEQERLFGDNDIEAARLGAMHRRAGFADEDALEVVRVLGQGMARYAEATRALVGRTFIEPGLDEYELSHRYAAVAEQLMPLAGPWLEHVFALHLQQVLRSDALTQEQRRTRGWPAGRRSTAGATGSARR